MLYFYFSVDLSLTFIARSVAMKILFLLSIAVLATARLQLKNDWEAWKREHGKAYSDNLEESLRHAIWFQNYHYIKDHNKKESFKLKPNEFADMVGFLFLYIPLPFDFILYFRQVNSFSRNTSTQ